jgi:large subunit ribosomal protein L29
MRICEIRRCVRDDNATSPRQGRLTLMKMKEITELSTDELLTKRRDLRQESLHLRLQQQSGQLEQPSRLRLLRRDIARLETVLSQRAKQTAAKK